MESGIEALHHAWVFRARPDDRHVAAQDVQELRQLVELRGPEQASQREHARITLRGYDAGRRIGGNAHRAQLVHRERSLIATDALRAIENRPGPTREPDPDRGDGEYGCDDDERHAGEEHVEG